MLERLAIGKHPNLMGKLVGYEGSKVLGIQPMTLFFLSPWCLV
jgi:hypothetical protein